MYVCGITPYDDVHLGHARAYVTFDIVRRHLQHSGYKVNYIQNFTDIDDKILNRAKEKNIAPLELAQKFIDDYFIQADKLNILRADKYPRVTESMPQIIEFVKKLVDKGIAYNIDGDIYFSVKKFAGYGKLSRRNLEELQAGARLEVDEQKNDPMDFALWKKSKQEDHPQASWDSPWGKGRPGWHIECSVMSTNSLGATLDIHGGGQDLIFPHHENEIAQSEAATGKKFCRYWIHNGFVTINKEKMSKSLGNFFTLKDIFEKFPPRVVRYFLLSQHYHSPLDFSDDKLNQAKNALDGIDDAYQRLSDRTGNNQPIDKSNVLVDILTQFQKTLNDDFNTENALSVIHILKNQILAELYNRDTEWLIKARNTMLLLIEDYMGINISTSKLADEVQNMLNQRSQARKEKNWAKADEIRDKVKSMGVEIIDNPDGTSTGLVKN